jgi:chemotaxis methyl-accepting protein methylase
VSQARSLSAGFANLYFEQGDISSFGSPRRFNLIVLADVIYYLPTLNDASVQSIAAKLTALLEPGGLLLLVNHFFFAVDPHSRMTRRIHNEFRASGDLTTVFEHRRAFYLATILERR